MRTEIRSGQRPKPTLADALLFLPSIEERQRLEVFRAHYTVRHGKADLTKRYTSTWPTPQQSWLFSHDPQEWFDGLPEFAKAFLVERIVALRAEDKLDPGLPSSAESEGAMSKSHDWISVGKSGADRLDPFWLQQYLGGAPREPDGSAFEMPDHATRIGRY